VKPKSSRSYSGGRKHLAENDTTKICLKNQGSWASQILKREEQESKSSSRAKCRSKIEPAANCLHVNLETYVLGERDTWLTSLSVRRSVNIKHNKGMRRGMLRCLLPTLYAILSVQVLHDCTLFRQCSSFFPDAKMISLYCLSLLLLAL